MGDNRLFLVLGLVFSVIIGLWWMYPRDDSPQQMDVDISDVPVPQSLSDHTQEFKNPEIIEVTDGVYVAIGFAIANVVMLEGPTGLIIVDVTESVESAEKINRAFRNITTKPVKAIVYTHSHADHILGSKAFLSETTEMPEIWAHHTIMDHYERSMGIASEISFKRASRQFGMNLGENLVNVGIGPRVNIGDGSSEFVKPEKFLYKPRERRTIAGLEIELMHIPGETANQIGVWIPSKKTMLCADDFYRAFPNLYAIRGTPTRDLVNWKDSVDKMRELRPEFLVPSHTRPISGEKHIYDLLTIYRDAIQFVHDQTVRFMNKGLTPDEIVERVSLPESLLNHPYLQQFYGTLAWSIRGTFHGYLGWFSGDPADLSPLSRVGRARRLVRLAGGIDKVLGNAIAALEDKDWQWALELASTVVVLEPANSIARRTKLDALKIGAAEQISSCGRNYYLTAALEEARQIDIKPSRSQMNGVIRTSTLEELFHRMSRRLQPEKCSHQNKQVSFNFTDVNVTVCIHLRHGIAEITSSNCTDAEMKVETTKTIWIQVLTKEVTAVSVYTSGQITIEGGLMAFKSFMDCFERI